MTRLVYILSFLTLGLTSCTGCTKANTTPPVCVGDGCSKPVAQNQPDANVVSADAGVVSIDPVVISAPVSKTISGDGWEFSVRPNWETVMFSDLPAEQQPDVALISPEEHNLVILVTEPVTVPLSEYVVSIAQAAAYGGAVIKSTSQADLNGTTFMVLDTETNDSHLWAWITVKNNIGYTLSCGGPKNENHKELCDEIFKSLIIK